MANSTQEFRGRFISFNDLDIIAVIHLTMDVYKSLHEDKKISEIVAGWAHQMEIAGPGSIDLMLDDYLQSPDEKNAFFVLLEGVRNRVKMFGSVVPVSVLSRPVAMGVAFKDYPAQEIHSCLDELENLVLGK